MGGRQAQAAGSCLRRDLLAAFAAKLSPSDIVVIEATGNASSAAAVVAPHVKKVVIANPKHVRIIAYAKIKTDTIDAGVLAQLYSIKQSLVKREGSFRCYSIVMAVSKVRYVLRKNARHKMLKRRPTSIATIIYRRDPPFFGWPEGVECGPWEPRWTMEKHTIGDDNFAKVDIRSAGC